MCYEQPNASDYYLPRTRYPRNQRISDDIPMARLPDVLFYLSYLACFLGPSPNQPRISGVAQQISVRGCEKLQSGGRGGGKKSLHNK